jgi:hypothetical protein
MDIEQLVSELNAKHYDQIRKSLQVVISPEDATMNPNLTANLRADRELKLALVREKLAAAQPQLVEAINLIHSLGLAQSHGEIYSHVADAHFYCGEAISEIDQHPHPDQ